MPERGTSLRGIHDRDPILSTLRECRCGKNACTCFAARLGRRETLDPSICGEGILSSSVGGDIQVFHVLLVCGVCPVQVVFIGRRHVEMSVRPYFSSIIVYLCSLGCVM